MVVMCLLYKHEALCSNPQHTKKRWGMCWMAPFLERGNTDVFSSQAGNLMTEPRNDNPKVQPGELGELSGVTHKKAWRTLE